MIEGKPSRTAAVVAALRGYGKHLASPLNKAGLDPYGLPFAGQPFTGIDALLAASPLLRRLCFGRDSAFLAYATTTHVLRTVAIDGAVESFQRSRSKQVVILGAGFDARALRLHASMPGMRWLEVDAPASQAAKRRALAQDAPHGAPGDDGPDIRFVAHNFETETGEQLKAKLVDAGLDLTQPVLTIMEGVVMYLTPDAAESTFALLYDISVPGSGVVFSHIPPSGLAKLSPWCVNWWLRLIFKHVFHESLNFGGWEPAGMDKWFQQRGWHLLWDRGYSEVARQAGCSPAVEAAVAGDFQRVAMAMVRKPVSVK